MKENNLPKDWKVKKLGEILKVSSGKGLKVNQLKGGIHAVYGGNGINGFHSEYNIEDSKLIIGRVGAKCGVTHITKQRSWVTDNALIVEPIILDFDKYYFKLLLESENLNKLSVSTAQPVISGSKLYEYKVLLPPLITQQQIVSKIEELFSELDKGVEDLKKAQQQLKTYRQSVLKWAFEGRLTNENVKDGVLPKGWELVKLDDIAFAIDPQPSHRTPPEVEIGIPYVSIKDFDSQLDKIDFKKARKVPLSVLDEHINRYKLELGDFVIGKIGTIGKPVRIVLPQNYTLSANIVLIQPRKINSTYLYYFFQSNIMEKAFTAGMKATTQAAFGIQKVRELKIELPSTEEQGKIVLIIESRLIVADKLEENIKESLQQAEVLRQSILKKAFCGELI